MLTSQLNANVEHCPLFPITEMQIKKGAVDGTCVIDILIDRHFIPLLLSEALWFF